MMIRDLLKRFLLWLVSGFGVALGVMLAVIGFDFVKPYLRPERPEVLANQGQLVVEQLAPLTVTRDGGVAAVIRNTTGEKSFRLEATELVFLQGEKVLFQCQIYMSPLVKAGGTISEQFLCSEVERASLPADVKYKLNIRSIREAV